MSLRIWLPLLGNLNNNGLSDVTVSNTNATVASNGKIGSCYSFDGSTSYLLGTHNFINNNTDDWSFCCWMKVNNAHTGCLFSCRNNVNYNGITIFYYGSQWIIDDGNRWQFTPTITIAANTWYHVCVVRKKGVGKFLYINGVLDSSTESVGTQTNVCPTYFSIGACQQGSPTSISGNWYNGYLNDIRFYDHGLSIKEIKEVARGLVCHYPLDGNGNVGYNYIKDTNTNNINTNKLFFSEQTGGSTRTIEYDNSIPCIKITRNTTEHSGYAYLQQGSVELSKIEVSKTYTVSFDIIASGEGTIGINGLVKGNATQKMSSSASIIQGSFNASDWSHVIIRITMKDSFEGITIDNQVVYMYCDYLKGTETWIKVKNFKMEEGPSVKYMSLSFTQSLKTPEYTV